MLGLKKLAIFGMDSFRNRFAPFRALGRKTGMNRFRVLPMVDDMADNKGRSQQTEQSEQEEGEEREEFVHGERGVGLFSEKRHVAQSNSWQRMRVEVKERLERVARSGHGGTGG